MGGFGHVIQIDECLLRGRRESNIGRLRLGDITAEQDNQANISGNRNYGRRLEGPWIFGLAEKLDDGSIDARFFLLLKETP